MKYIQTIALKNKTATATRKAAQLLMLALPIAAVLAASGCKKEVVEPEPTGADQVRTLLIGSAWRIQSVTVDGSSQNSLFPGLTITFTANGFTATNGEPVWPASGTWSFTSDTGQTISRSDGVTITVNEITSTRLQLTLTWTKTTLGGGRQESISGEHIFTFTP